MKIDVTQILRDLDGKPIDENATLRKACLEALLSPLKGDENMQGADKQALFALADRVHAETSPDLAIEEWAKIKDRIGRAYPPLIVGRAYAMIDPPAKLKAVTGD